MDSVIHVIRTVILVCYFWKSNTSLEIGAAGRLTTTSVHCGHVGTTMIASLVCLRVSDRHIVQRSVGDRIVLYHRDAGDIIRDRR